MPELIPAAPGTPEWLAYRRQGVTATDIVTILGLNSQDSAYALYWRKVGDLPDPGDTDRWRLGRYMEPYVVERWSQDYDWHTPRYEGLYRHSERAWQMATLDRSVYEREPLECKSWADADRTRWDDQPPPAVRAQVLWQMDVMDAARGHVGVVFLPSGEFRSYTIEHDESPVREYPHDIPGPLASGICRACADLGLMRERGAEFYARLTGELPPPSPDASQATTAALKARFADPAKGKRVPVPLELWNPWVGACIEAERWAAVKRAHENSIREVIGQADELEVDGQLVARRMRFPQNVKAHTRTMDFLKRVKNGDDNE